MSTIENLKPIRKGELSREEAKARGSNGGKRSVEVRREKKTIKMALDILLETMITNKADGTEATGLEAMCTAMFAKALRGDTKAFELIRDSIGEKPKDVTEITSKTVFVTKKENAKVKAHIDQVIGKDTE